jgi:hypothetical protein
MPLYEVIENDGTVPCRDGFLNDDAPDIAGTTCN